MKKFLINILNKLRKPLLSIFQFLIVITPFVAASPSSVLFWGETKCPKEILDTLITKKKS
ncbi:MAG: hypothetical protein PHD33_07660 [Atribacterota bacterium]|nr:hypothetical protein [Atribacterota bacterium]